MLKSVFYGFFIFFIMVGIGHANVSDRPTEFDVRTFGAKGDGQTKDTIAIQKAIDTCSESGGGTVVVPPGVWLTGSLFLKSNVDFYLMRGATLLGSPDQEDYNKKDVCPQNAVSLAERSFGAHLILCIEQKNVTLRGPGQIDGNSLAFIVDDKGTPWASTKIPWRPSQMVYFVESHNIRVQDIELVNSPYWTSFYHGCTHVFLRGIQIRNSRHPHTHNGDGIDIDCCEYVSVSDCQIDSADDCITVRGSVGRLKTPRPCRYISITNCVLSSPCNCFRFGVGDGLIENVVVSNIVIETARTAFNFVSSWREGGRGTDIRNVQIQNVVVDCEVLLQMYYKYAKITEFRNISMRGVSGVLRQVSDMDPARRDESCVWLNQKTLGMVQMEGNPNQPLRDIRLSDIYLDVFPEAQWQASNVEGLALENISLRSVDPNHPVVFLLDNVRDLKQIRVEPPIK